MEKKRGIAITAVMVLILSSLNLFLFFNKKGPSYSSLSGMFVQEIPELPLNMDISLVAFVGQWIILLLIIILTYTKFLKHKKNEVTKGDYNAVKQKKTKAGTDMDVLYNLLKNKKRLNTKAVSELFKIPKEKALEWAKILENHDLAIVEYPTFSDPEIILNEKDSERENPDEKSGEDEVEKEKKESQSKKTKDKTKIKNEKETKTSEREKTEGKAKSKGENKPGKKVEKRKIKKKKKQHN